MVRRIGAALVAIGATLALDAKAEVCDDHRVFTVDKNATTEVNLYKTFWTIHSLSDVVDQNTRFILEGQSSGNNLSCDFRGSYQLSCDVKGKWSQVIITPWKTFGQKRTGGANQCVWDGNWRLEGFDQVDVPSECIQVRVNIKYEATVRNSGKLQVVDVYRGIPHCGKP